MPKPTQNQIRESICSKVIYRNATFAKPLAVEQQRADTTITKGADATFILISNANQTERYDWWEDEIYIEELDVTGADYSQLKTFFKDHEPSVDNAIGLVENLRVESGQLIGDVRFSRDEKSQIIKQKYDDGILTDVSIGYRVDDYVLTEQKDAPTHVLVTKYRIVELSAVWKGADTGAIRIKNDSQVEANEKRFSYELYEKKLNLKLGAKK